ncbi:MAG: HlyD family secretion protein [Legionella sp.]|uniref:HlyD family secretion protein n=1 Tax=Legionella sp. TaxID=459 RepID=UPI00284FB5F9|nr:HlyD family secretion protein [Legionella sp.]
METMQEVHEDSDLVRTEKNDALPQSRNSVVKNASVIIFSLLALGGCVAFGLPMLQETLSYTDTDDAYVTGHVHTVSSKIAGTISKVLVEDNQAVREGQPLALIEPYDQQVIVRKAEAHLLKVQRDSEAAGQTTNYGSAYALAASKTAEGNIAVAKSRISHSVEIINDNRSGVSLSRQMLNQRQAELHKAQLDLKRYKTLEEAGAVSTESLDTARRDYEVALAARAAAKDALFQAESKLKQAIDDLQTSKAELLSAQAFSQQSVAAHQQVSVDKSQHASAIAAIEEAKAELADAKLKLSYTIIKAPIGGFVGRKSGEEGQRVQAGMPLLAVVSPNKWIVANFKETQLRDIRSNQPVKITIDAFPDHKFTGKVDSFSPASGAQFALLPPDNATGNFTKIVQRMPVKVLIDPQSMGEFKPLIAPGMSCIVKVKTR